MPARNILWICALPGLVACSVGIVGGEPQDPTDGEHDWSGATNTHDTVTQDTDPEDPPGDSGSGSTTATDDEGGETSDTGGPGETDDAGGDDSTGEPHPKVLATVPAAGAMGIARDIVIALEFNRPIRSGSIVTNAGSARCEGTVQVSRDGFGTCLPLEENVSALQGDTRFELRPTELLHSRGHYRILVTTAIRSLDDVGLEQDYVSSEPFVARYGHTVAIDGVNDFIASDEALAASSPGIMGYVGWDEAYIYLGLDAPDVASGNSALFWFAYLGGEEGSTSGVGYQNQTPVLPFGAQWHPRWKSDNTYSNVQQYDDGWKDAATIGLDDDDIAQSGTFVEMRLPRADLGDPSTLPLVMGLLREELGNEATYGLVPGNAIVDGFDPDYVTYIDFELEGSLLPSEHPVL